MFWAADFWTNRFWADDFWTGLQARREGRIRARRRRMQERRARHQFSIKIDDELFVVDSIDEMLELLRTAQEIAESFEDKPLRVKILSGV
jgi:hypothetical protein